MNWPDDKYMNKTHNAMMKRKSVLMVSKYEWLVWPFNIILLFSITFSTLYNLLVHLTMLSWLAVGQISSSKSKSTGMNFDHKQFSPIIHMYVAKNSTKPLSRHEINVMRCGPLFLGRNGNASLTGLCVLEENCASYHVDWLSSQRSVQFE